ncbi:CRISPR-associated protein Cmr6 [Azospirillaceae bacterium]
MSLILPDQTCRLIASLKNSWSDRHPGLQLDKLSPPAGDEHQMKEQKERLDEVIKCKGGNESSALLNELAKRRQTALEATKARVFTATTTGPLTLHLSRATALENAGLCLHPVHGFAYLPGSGLKGMTRAWAETVAGTSADEIKAVFGWASGEKDKNGVELKNSHAGGVVFHDALPCAWPELRVEITNNHHQKYYQGTDAPGDWESPIPIYFLSVKPNTRFSFALSPARGCDPAHFDLAVTWLKAALRHAGAGAKTAAGFGCFRLDNNLPAPSLPQTDRLVRFETTLTLVSPAFLAGADQQEADCDLRPGALRGLLRWWWRTLHAAHVDVKELRRLEALVWGGVGQSDQAKKDDKGEKFGGSPVAIHLCKSKDVSPRSYDKQQIARSNVTTSRRSTPMGLYYASYGMDEKIEDRRTGVKETRRRYYMPDGASWELTISARAVGKGEISASEILRQVQTVLWLLVHYGGIGSKARKGFGSIKSIPVDGVTSVDDCKKIAETFRRTAKAQKGRTSEGMAIEDAKFMEMKIEEENIWQALNNIGEKLQSFTKSLEKSDRWALGLPRKGRSGPKGDRHASPIWWRLEPGKMREYHVRATGFPAAFLPNLQKSKEILSELGKDISSFQRQAMLAAPNTIGAGLVGQRGRVDGEPCIVQKEKKGELYVDFDDENLDSEWISASKFVPTNLA